MENIGFITIPAFLPNKYFTLDLKYRKLSRLFQSILRFINCNCIPWIKSNCTCIFMETLIKRFPPTAKHAPMMRFWKYAKNSIHIYGNPRLCVWKVTSATSFIHYKVHYKALRIRDGYKTKDKGVKGIRYIIVASSGSGTFWKRRVTSENFSIKARHQNQKDCSRA